MKRIIFIAVFAVLVLNAAYIGRKVNDFNNSEDIVICMLEAGIGTGTESTVSDSVYGKEYVATYHVEDNEIIREFEWK